MAQRLTSVDQIDFEPVGKVFASPDDWRDVFMYQLLIDRFDNAAEDLKPYDPKTAQRGRDRAQGDVFQGGKLRGITRRLDYIKGLGCNALWISPPFKNRQDEPHAYHGYSIQDFLAVDPRFGTLQDLQELTREAHRRGMYVICDIVINHTADVFRYREEQTPFRAEGRYEFGQWHKVSKAEHLGADDAIWPVELQDPECFSRRGSIRNLQSAPEEEVRHGDFFNLKDLETHNPKVMDVLIKCYKYWIATCDLDGFRIDTARHVEPDALARFSNAIHEYCVRIGKRRFIIFGEIVGDDALLHKYVGNNGPALGTEQWFPRLDATLDFPLYRMLDEAIKGQKSCVDLRGRYEHFRQYYRDAGEAGRYYVTFIDNHDQGERPFRRFLNGTQDWRIGVAGIGYLLGNIGVPCIYYGTEQGFDGGGDSDVFVRETMFGGAWGAFDTKGMHFFNDRNPIYRGIAALARVRAAQLPLRYGREYFRDISGNGQDFGCPVDGNATLAFSRVLDTEEVLVAINLSDQPREDAVAVDGMLSPPDSTMRNLVDPKTMYRVQRSDKGVAYVRVKLEGHGIVVMKRR